MKRPTPEKTATTKTAVRRQIRSARTGAQLRAAVAAFAALPVDRCRGLADDLMAAVKRVRSAS